MQQLYPDRSTGVAPESICNEVSPSIYITRAKSLNNATRGNVCETTKLISLSPLLLFLCQSFVAERLGGEPRECFLRASTTSVELTGASTSLKYCRFWLRYVFEIIHTSTLTSFSCQCDVKHNNECAAGGLQGEAEGLDTPQVRIYFGFQYTNPDERLK